MLSADPETKLVCPDLSAFWLDDSLVDNTASISLLPVRFVWLPKDYIYILFFYHFINIKNPVQLSLILYLKKPPLKKLQAKTNKISPVTWDMTTITMHSYLSEPKLHWIPSCLLLTAYSHCKAHQALKRDHLKCSINF